MAPSAVVPETTHETTRVGRKPLQLSGVLDPHRSFDVTPVIGREFPEAKLVDWLNAPNSDELLRDLAITISQRGVVFFRAQDGLTNELQKKLILRLGELSGRPATSGLHIHPLLNSERELGGDDPEISTISSIQNKKYYRPNTTSELSPKKQSTAQWHSDIAFEPVPADYTSLRLVELPSTGGGMWPLFLSFIQSCYRAEVLTNQYPDTLWASGYEIYDRLSEPYQKFLETLTVTFEQPGFKKVAEQAGFKLYDKPRGAIENVGTELKAVHPVVRTNPVTGWKSIFPVGGHVKHINGVTDEESAKLLSWFLDLVYRNHDLQVRLKWKNPNDIGE